MLKTSFILDLNIDSASSVKTCIAISDILKKLHTYYYLKELIKNSRVNGANHVVIALVLLMGLTQCDQTTLDGEYNENIPPTTDLTVNKIERSGELRLSSQINISWWGDDPDGYVIGYEFAIGDPDTAKWHFTNVTDSTFVLPIAGGNDTADVTFSVRAVDNDSLRDPSPAQLDYPIKNTAPEASFNDLETPPDTTYTIASLGWNVDDLDGLANIERAEIAINDTANGWVEFSVNQDFITLDIDPDNTSSGQPVSADVYLGENYRSSEYTLNGFSLNARNKAMVRAVDNAGATSSVDTVEWYIKEQTSNILLINDDGSNNSNEALTFHRNRLSALDLNVDYWDITDGTAEGDRKVSLSDRFPATIDPTLQKILAQWDYIYWFSNDINRNITYAPDITAEFFENGGKMYVNIPMKQISNNDPILNFIPASKIGELTGIQSSFEIFRNDTVHTVSSYEGPLLTTNRQISTVFPLQAAPGADTLYEADFKIGTVVGSTEEYEEFEYVGLKNAEDNLIYFSLDPRWFNETNNVNSLLEQFLIEDLGFN